nr:transcription factor HBP-1B(C38)-like [Ipomoea batatas]
MLRSPPSSSSVIPPPHGNLISKDNTRAYDLGELDQALFLYLDGHRESSSIQDHRENSGMRPPTLNIFPSWTCPGGLSDQRKRYEIIDAIDGAAK